MNITIPPHTYSNNNGEVFCLKHAPAELLERFAVYAGADYYEVEDNRGYFLVNEKNVRVTVEKQRKGGVSVRVFVPECDECFSLNNR